MLNESNTIPTFAGSGDRRAPISGSDIAAQSPVLRQTATGGPSVSYGRTAGQLRPDCPPPSPTTEDHSHDHFGTTTTRTDKSCSDDAAAGIRPEASHPVHVFCTDPYAWFAERGEVLAACSIGILPAGRSNGVQYTGRFNIAGFTYTVGAPTVDGLYLEAMAKRCRHLQAIWRRRQRKLERCRDSFHARHPEAPELPWWLSA